MRRLPIFFVIDVSESMAGPPIGKVENGLRHIITSLQKDPYALETAYISVIVFAGKAITLVPLSEIATFYPPKLSIGSGTSYGAAISHLQSELKLQTHAPTHTSKGDWKPIVFFMSDGAPTDNCNIDLGLWESTWKDKVTTVVVAIGSQPDLSILNRISQNILHIDDSNPEAYNQFFNWVTASIKVQSQSIESSGNQGEIDLKKATNSGVKEIDLDDFDEQGNVDESYAIFYGRCQNNEDNYLIKYKRDSHKSDFLNLPDFVVENYRIEGAYLLDDQFESLSQSSESGGSAVNTELLRGSAPCPSCGNRFSLCLCQCGGIFCLDDVGMNTCPHCKVTSNFGHGGGHIDIDRQLG